jgi:hypothetical protein
VQRAVTHSGIHVAKKTLENSAKIFS